MSRMSCRTKRNRSVPRKHCSKWLCAALGIARSRSFWILEAGDLLSPLWTIYSLDHGQAVASYWPASGTWTGIGRLAGEKGETRSFRELFDLIRALERW